MRSLLFRPGALGALVLFTVSCSQAPQGDSSESSTELRRAGEAPDIAPSAAPGVSFNYDYRFRLPDNRISATQEAHAAACEQMGLVKCRITGMSYSVDRDENVSASLNLKLDPAIARAFGKSASALVEKNDGRLDSLEIGSNDEGEQIGNANRERAAIQDRIAKIEAELARTKDGDQRAALTQQLDALRAEASRQTNVIAGSETALASTPMTFTYYGEGGAPGFRGNPLRESWHLFVATFITLAGFLLRAIAVLVPLGLVLAVLVLLWRSPPVRHVRRWLWENGVAEPTDAGDPPRHP